MLRYGKSIYIIEKLPARRAPRNGAETVTGRLGRPRFVKSVGVSSSLSNGHASNRDKSLD